MDLIEITSNPEDIREKSKLTKDEWREFTKTVWQIANTSHPIHPAVFPEEIPKRLIKLFTFHSETVLDPFAGTGTTARAAISLCRKAICIEQNREYVDLIRSNFSQLQFGYATPDFLQIIQADSRNFSSLDNDSIHLVVTSPPYWNKADYGGGSENLGNIQQYRHFLTRIQSVFENCFRVLVPGRKICVVTANVNQYTDHGLLTFPLAADFTIMLREIGFVMITEIIWSKDKTGGKWGSFGEQRPIFGSYPYPPNFLFKNIHEYVLVFAKPPSKINPSARALPYEWLMADEADDGKE